METITQKEADTKIKMLLDAPDNGSHQLALMYADMFGWTSEDIGRYLIDNFKAWHQSEYYENVSNDFIREFHGEKIEMIPDTIFQNNYWHLKVLFSNMERGFSYGAVPYKNNNDEKEYLYELATKFIETIKQSTV